MSHATLQSFISDANSRASVIEMINEIHSVAVVVSDRKRATQWYVEKLGFVVLEDAADHWTVVAPPGWRTGLHLCEAETLEPGNTGILLYPDDFDATVKELKKKGVEFTQEPKEEPWGTYAMFKDPDGNVFWLMPKE